MTISEERQAFAARLQSALRQARQPADSPTTLARGFNSRYPGQPITVHAARKWLVAESIPTQDKLRTLAQWLEVPAEWLRFGGPLSSDTQGTHSPIDKTLDAMLSAMSREDLKLVEALHALEADERRLVRDLVQLFFRTQERVLGNASPA